MKRMGKKKVVITGLGLITPLGGEMDSYWRGLMEGRSHVSQIKTFDATNFTTRIAAQIPDFDPEQYFDKKTVRRMDPFVQYAAVAAIDAFGDSGIDVDKEDPGRVGVLIGSGIGGIKTLTDQCKILIKDGPRRISPFFIPMMIINMASGRVSMILGVKGPNYSVSSACSTANHAIGEAMNIILKGDADVMIAGGSEAALVPLGVGGFCSMKALSTRNDDPERASRPFDRDRDGFVMGEGAGIVVLESEEHAKKRGANIYAELAGYGATGDAYHMTAPAPEGRGAARCMREALEDAELNPDDIDYINAHGTSTPLNDKLETLAIKTVFGDRASDIPISSTKSMTGHLLGAAGAVELITCVLSIKNKTVHQTANYETPDPECDLDYVPEGPREVNVRAALSNSLGFGGHNATLVVKKYK
jgi:3-oxoacyl-[acyl-carrier-protein] synthase II